MVNSIIMPRSIELTEILRNVEAENRRLRDENRNLTQTNQSLTRNDTELRNRIQNLTQELSSQRETISEFEIHDDLQTEELNSVKFALEYVTNELEHAQARQTNSTLAQLEARNYTLARRVEAQAQELRETRIRLASANTRADRARATQASSNTSPGAGRENSQELLTSLKRS